MNFAGVAIGGMEPGEDAKKRSGIENDIILLWMKFEGSMISGRGSRFVFISDDLTTKGSALHGFPS